MRSSGEEPSVQPVVGVKPAEAKEERNSDSNSDDPQEEKPASKDAGPAAKPSNKEEPPDDNSADGCNDVKKPAANNGNKPAPGEPMYEEDADEAVKYKMDHPNDQVNHQDKPFEHIKKHAASLELVVENEERNLKEFDVDESSEVSHDKAEEVDIVSYEKEEKVTIDVALQEKEEKEARAHNSLSVVASQVGKAADVASQEEKGVDADAVVASREREEKEAVYVDATKLDNNTKVSAADESQKQEVQLQSELFENDDESIENDVQTNDDEQSNDDHANENDDHPKEIDEVNGNEDQVKTEELFDSIAITLFFPNYKYRKKRWPEKLDK